MQKVLMLVIFSFVLVVINYFAIKENLKKVNRCETLTTHEDDIYWNFQPSNAVYQKIQSDLSMNLLVFIISLSVFVVTAFLYIVQAGRLQ